MEIGSNGRERRSAEGFLDSQRWCIELPPVIGHGTVAYGAKISVVVRRRVVEVLTLARKTIRRQVELDLGWTIVIVHCDPPLLLVRLAKRAPQKRIVEEA